MPGLELAPEAASFTRLLYEWPDLTWLYKIYDLSRFSRLYAEMVAKKDPNLKEKKTKIEKIQREPSDRGFSRSYFGV